ncbi:hypothetical protein ACO2Q2_10550 [Dyella sp. KRB-257]|uniref:hypothetical protein n=1 Tax=Dyella sp. KRB-257 TaxID=3400915 RepID=UPI003C0A2FD9
MKKPGIRRASSFRVRRQDALAFEVNFLYSLGKGKGKELTRGKGDPGDWPSGGNLRQNAGLMT